MKLTLDMKIIEFIKFVFVSIPLAIIIYILAIILQALVKIYKTIKNINHGHRK